MGWIDDYKRHDPHAKVGMRIRLISMEDEHGVPPGTEGVITKIDSLGTLHVKWDNGRSLGVIPDEDLYDLLPQKNPIGENKKQPLTTKIKRDFKQNVNKERLGVKVEGFRGGNMGFKDEVNRILDTLKTAKPIHRTSLENMVKNLNTKYKGVKKNEVKFRELILNLYQKIEDRFGLDETTTTGSAMGSTPIQPLGGTPHKGHTKNSETKGSLKNPTGVKYDIKEETSLKSLDKNREDSTYDRPTWANKKTWIKLKNLAWKDGEVIDVSKYLDVDSEDPVVIKNKKKLKESKKDTTKSEDDDNIEETTTMSSVFNGNFPVTPYMFAKKGKHIPSKKTLWKGGKIVQKVNRADLLGEDVLEELNKVKWVKNGKFVKIKDRCAKYNNQPHCSQGAIDNPLIFSEETINNIKKISEEYGVDVNHIIELVKEKMDLKWVDGTKNDRLENFMDTYTDLKPSIENTKYHGKKIVYRDESGEWVFFHETDASSGYIWVNYSKIWSPLLTKFKLNRQELSDFMSDWLNKNYGLKNTNINWIQIPKKLRLGEKIIREEIEDFKWIEDMDPKPWEEFMFPYTNLESKLQNTSWGPYINYNDDSGKFIFFHSPDIDEDNIVWFNYEKVWKPLKDKFNLNMDGVDKLLRHWLLKNYGMDGVRTLSRPSIS